MRKQNPMDKMDESEGTAAFHHKMAHQHMRKAVAMAKKEGRHGLKGRHKKAEKK